MLSHTIVISSDVIEVFHSCFFDTRKRPAFQQLRFIPRKQALGIGVVIGLAGSDSSIADSPDLPASAEPFCRFSSFSFMKQAFADA